MRACPVACGLCTHVCTDHDERCTQWAVEKRCTDDRAMMLQVRDLSALAKRRLCHLRSLTLRPPWPRRPDAVLRRRRHCHLS